MLLSSVNFVSKPKAGKPKKVVVEKKQIVEEKPTATKTSPSECEVCKKEVSTNFCLYKTRA